MKEIKFLFENNDLASRSTAATKRAQVMPHLEQGSLISFDFSNVESVSASYADELFGVLARDFGLDAVAQKIRLHNCNDFCAKEIAEAIYRRASHRAVA